MTGKQGSSPESIVREIKRQTRRKFTAEEKIRRYMKYTQSEKMEIIRMVEESSLSVKQSLREMDVPHSSFYEWYIRYKEAGYDGLASKHKRIRQVWNKIPEWEKERVVEVAREYPE
jgi:putative transposase